MTDDYTPGSDQSTAHAHGRAQTPIDHGNTIPCGSCGFDLRGHQLGQPCPECGTPVHQFAQSSLKQGKAVASMVLGICSIVTCMFYGLPGLICGILAIVFAKKARVAVQLGEAPASSLGMAKAGRICGWVGLALSSVYIVLGIVYLIFIIGMIGAAGMAGGGLGPPVGGTGAGP